MLFSNFELGGLKLALKAMKFVEQFHESSNKSSIKFKVCHIIIFLKKFLKDNLIVYPRNDV